MGSKAAGLGNKGFPCPQLGAKALALCRPLRSRGSVPGAGPRAWQVAVNTGGPPRPHWGGRLRTQAVIMFCAVWYVWQKRRPTGEPGSSRSELLPKADPRVRLEEQFGGLLNKVK